MPSSARVGGLVAGAVGLGILGYYGYPYIARSLSGVSIVSVAFNPGQPVSGQPWSATVNLKAPAGTVVGAEGAVVQTTNSLVGGHLWASAADADNAYNTFWTAYNGAPGTAAQKTVAGLAAVASLAGQFTQRVPTVTADSSGAAQLTLFSEALSASQYTVAIFAAAHPSGLIVQDPVGTTLANLKRATAQQAQFSLTVAQATASLARVA